MFSVKCEKMCPSILLKRNKNNNDNDKQTLDKTNQASPLLRMWFYQQVVFGSPLSKLCPRSLKTN